MLFYLRKLFCYISLFFFRGVLSDKNIKKLLGYHIFIYPFREENLKPSSYNLTASKFAFVIEKEGDEEKQKLIIKDNKIIIPPHKTAIIETEESIYVSKWITGSYHSKVKMVNKGLGHIGTTLDPCFFGVSAIAMTNHTDEEIKINVGDSIVTLMFYSLKSRAKGMHNNLTARIDTNINLNCKEFYNFDNKHDNNEVLIIQKNKLDDNILKMKLEDCLNTSTFIQNVITLVNSEQSCEKCIDCNNKNSCAIKFIKNYNAEDIKKEKIRNEIEEWKKQPYIHTKQELIEKVRTDIKIKNTTNDIFIYSLLLLGFGILFIIGLYLFAKNKLNNQSIEWKFIEPLITITIPIAVALIGIIANYKIKYKEEHKS